MDMNANEELAPPNNGFRAQAKWRLLDPNGNDIVDEVGLQTIDGARFHKPTVRDHNVEDKKAQQVFYETTYDRPPFTEKRLQPQK